MLRLLVFILFFISFSSFSKYFTVIDSTDGTLIGNSCSESSVKRCANLLPETYQDKPIDPTRTASGSSYTLNEHYLFGKYRLCITCKEIVFTLTLFSLNSCSSEEQCKPIAEGICSAESKRMVDFNYISPNKFTYNCVEDTSEAQKCENTVTQQCSANGGLGSSNFLDSGNGSTSCSGVCGDGTIADAAPDPDCSVAPFCDVPDPDGNSDLDFGAGGSGSDVLPPSSSSGGGDAEHEIDYEPDGSTADSQTGMSTLQGDKLINEVVKNRNNNAEALVATTDSTNKTIVEKSDDIQNTLANSANGIIDAINGIDTTGEPFNDGNIVGGIDALGDKIDDIDEKLDGLTGPYDTTPTESGTYKSLFDVGSIDAWKTKINILKVDINSEMRGFKFDLKKTMSFTTTANGYAPNSLDLGQWGSHDISLSRFADFFGGVGNIIYFLASLTALSIVLGGIRL